MGALPEIFPSKSLNQVSALSEDPWIIDCILRMRALARIESLGISPSSSIRPLSCATMQQSKMQFFSHYLKVRRLPREERPLRTVWLFSHLSSQAMCMNRTCWTTISTVTTTSSQKPVWVIQIQSINRRAKLVKDLWTLNTRLAIETSRLVSTRVSLTLKIASSKIVSHLMPRVSSLVITTSTDLVRSHRITSLRDELEARHLTDWGLRRIVSPRSAQSKTRLMLLIQTVWWSTRKATWSIRCKLTSLLRFPSMRIRAWISQPSMWHRQAHLWWLSVLIRRPKSWSTLEMTCNS